MPTPYTTRTTSSLNSDTKKQIAAKTLAIAERQLVFYKFAEEEQLARGHSVTAYWYRYERLDPPTSTLTEGTTPSATTLSNTEVSATVAQWGQVVTITDLAEMTINHPLAEIAKQRVGDAMSSLIDREISLVALAGTGITYGGSATARSGLAAGDTFTSTVIRSAVQQLRDNGAPTFESGHYVGFISPSLEADLRAESATGGFVEVMRYNGKEKFIEGEIGTWEGVRWVRTNFMPVYQRITAVSGSDFSTATTGGSLAGSTTFYFKVVRKNLANGFEDEMTAEISSATGAGAPVTHRITFTAPATAGFVYDLYAGSASGDANLFLHTSDIAVSGTGIVNTIPTSGATAPVTPASGVSAYPGLIIGKGFYGATDLERLKGTYTPPGGSGDELEQRRSIGAKTTFASVILNQNFGRRIEVAS